MRRILLLLAVLPAWGEDAVRELKVETEGENVRYRGRVDAPDGLLISLTLRHQHIHLLSREWKILKRLRVKVQGGSFDYTFRIPEGLPFGSYKLEADVDPDRQIPGLRIPPGPIRGLTPAVLSSVHSNRPGGPTSVLGNHGADRG